MNRGTTTVWMYGDLTTRDQRAEQALRYVEQLEAHLDEGGLYRQHVVRGLIAMVREFAS
jgi:hypothetical protein